MRRLGKTNLKINEIGFGGIPIQRTTIEEVCRIVEEMVSNNINFIDTARAYTISEKYLGIALQGKRDKFILATKSMARNYEDMKKDINTSLQQLQTNYIDLYQIHNVRLGENIDGAIQALKEAKAYGKIHHIGITSHNYDLLMEMIDNSEFETIQFPYNIIETKAEKLFQKAKTKDIGVIVMKPLAGGAIDNAHIALKFILNNDNVDVAIPGMANCQEVIENSGVKKGKFTNKENDYIKEIRNLLNEDFCRRCGYCLPCSVGIQIPLNFLFAGYYERYGLKEWAIDRYKSMAVMPDKCIECGICETRCPYNLKIIQKLKYVSNLFKGIKNE